MAPSDCRYTKTHEWVKIDGDMAAVGITDHAQHEMGDITFVEAPAAGRVVKQGESCGVVESVKAASDLFAPIGGEVAEVNGELEAQPELLNQDPHGRGWIFKLRNAKIEDMAGLMDAAAYDASLS